MAFTEDISLFFADFGVEAVFGEASVTVLLDRPDAEVLGGAGLTNDPVITYATGDLAGLAMDSEITVDGVDYLVRGTPRKIDDGKLMQAFLVPA